MRFWNWLTDLLANTKDSILSIMQRMDGHSTVVVRQLKLSLEVWKNVMVECPHKCYNSGILENKGVKDPIKLVELAAYW